MRSRNFQTAALIYVLLFHSMMYTHSLPSLATTICSSVVAKPLLASETHNIFFNLFSIFLLYHSEFTSFVGELRQRDLLQPIASRVSQDDECKYISIIFIFRHDGLCERVDLVLLAWPFQRYSRLSILNRAFLFSAGMESPKLVHAVRQDVYCSHPPLLWRTTYDRTDWRAMTPR